MSKKEFPQMTTPHAHLNLGEIYDTKLNKPNKTDKETMETKQQTNGQPTRTQFLKSYGHNVQPERDQPTRLRLKYFCHHVRWICRNIVNLEAIESRKDVVTFSLRNVQKLKSHATILLKSAEKSDYVKLDKTMPDILKLLHALESAAAREYIAPILSNQYLKHIQGMGMSVMNAFLDEYDDHEKSRAQELSQYMIPVYFNLSTLLHLLDIDLHNSLFYQCTTLIQKYHMVASGRYHQEEKSFYEQHVPYLNEALGLFELIDEMVRDSSSSSSLSIPTSVASLWVHELKLALNMFELYKEEL